MTAKFAIRIAVPADEAAVGALLAASYPPLLAAAYDPAVLAAAAPLVTRANPVLLASGSYYLAESDEGTAVGCGGWSRERPGSGEREPGLAYIRHFAVHADWTGHGIGRALFARCETDAQRAGASRFECYATLNAEGFYRALGFARLRRIEVPLAPGIVLPSLLMTREM